MILLRPIAKEYPETQMFGENPDDYQLTNGHNGIDYGTKGFEGVPIIAATDGVVTRANIDNATAIDPKAGYGYHVRIRHGDESTTLYAHLREGGILVKTGQRVRMGDVIGESGNTGMSTGPHLHFELRVGESGTSAVDPRPFIVDEIPPENGLFEVTVTLEGNINLRGGPSTNYIRIGHVETGDKVNVFGFAGNDTWLQVSDGFLMFDPKWYKLSKVGEEEGLIHITVTNEGENVRLRTGPSTSHDIKTNLKSGDQKTVIGITGGNIWLRTQRGFIFYKPEWYSIVGSAAV